MHIISTYILLIKINIVFIKIYSIPIIVAIDKKRHHHNINSDFILSDIFINMVFQYDSIQPTHRF